MQLDNLKIAYYLDHHYRLRNVLRYITQENTFIEEISQVCYRKVEDKTIE